MLQTFHEMWAELLEELMDGILDHPTIESVHSLDHSPAPLSDDESFHSATEELDEPVEPPPIATDESTPPPVQSPHRMDQQETSES